MWTRQGRPVLQPLGELEPGIGLCSRAGVVQVHLVAGVLVRVVEGADEIGKGFVDDGLRAPSLRPHQTTMEG